MVQMPTGRDMRERLRDIIVWVRRARELGFDYIYCGQHYVTHPYQAFQPLPLIARLAPEAGDMRFVVTIVMPLHHPVEVAEQLSTLDIILDGRLTLTVALGYREEEWRAFGVESKQRVSRLVEGLECLVKLWTEDEVTYHGHHFVLEKVRMPTKPTQRPHPPIWIAANNDPAVVRAGRLGFPWHINPHATYDTIAGQVMMFREAARAAGKPWDVGLALNREVYCAETKEQALREAQPFLGAKYETYAQWGQDKALPGDEDFLIAFEKLAKGRFIIGGPEECSQELEQYRALGIEYAHFRMSWAGMPVEQSLRSMELMAEQVIPRFRS